MSKENETTTQTTGNKNVLDPYLRASRAWVIEVEKLQQTTFDHVSKAMDEGYKLAKESLGNIAAIQANVRKQWQSQLERANDFVTSFIP
jgi:CHASE3 domain sensor protein